MVETSLNRIVVSIPFDFRKTLYLFRLGFQTRGRYSSLMRGSVHLEAIDAHDHFLPHLDFALMAVGLFLNLRVEPTRFQRDQRSALRINESHVLPDRRFKLVGQAFDKVGTAERIGRARYAGLVGQDLLRAKRDADGLIGGQPERFVEG